MARDFTKHFRIKGPMTLREVTLQTGLSEDTLRYYEKVGLLPKITRDASSNQRRYSVDNVYTAYKLAALRATGMPLKKMKEYINNNTDSFEHIDQQIELLNNQKRIVESKLMKLQHQLDYLEKKTEHYSAMKSGDDDAMDHLEIQMIRLAKELNSRLKNSM